MTEIYTQILDLLRSTTSIEDPEALLGRYCREINKPPSQIQLDDSGQLVMLLMTDLSRRIPPTEWDDLDAAIKESLMDPGMNRNKVKGIVLEGVLDYIGTRLGPESLSQVRSKAGLPANVNRDGWYPFSLLEDLLTEAEDRLPIRNGFRSRAVGKYIVSKKNLAGADYLFGKKTPSEIVAIWNIDKVISLEGLTLTELELGNIELTFKGNCSRQSAEFMKGVLEGIFDLRGKTLSRNELESREPELNLMVICYES